MDNLKPIVSAVLGQQRLQLAPSTYDVRRQYLEQLLVFAEEKGISNPCQELYDSYISRATTPDLRFQLFHAVRLVDKEAGTKAFTPEGKLYNEPEIPSLEESERIFREISFPISDGSIDTGHLIRRAEHEMEYLQLSASTNWQYMQAWRELYINLYLQGDTKFTRASCTAFIESSIQKRKAGIHHEWKRKIQCRATHVLLEIADTGRFEWKLFTTRKVCCPEETLEELRQQYIAFLRTQNLENKTIALYDYSFRSLIEGLSVSTVSDLAALKPKQVQATLVFLSGKLSLNSRGTIFPILRQILSYLYRDIRQRIIRE